jgi:Spy/CpxP family protein refolding chaperone
MGPGMGMHGGMYGGMHGGMVNAETVAARLADLKTELKITGAQEGAWQAYVAVVQQQAAARDALRAQMQGPEVTPADRSAHFEAMSKFREEHLAARTAALNDLYAVLTPEQKQLADQRLMPGRGPGMAWRAPAK